jgi:endonuclease YncB( thermonuclease family)
MANNRLTPIWRALLSALALAGGPHDAEAQLRCPMAMVQGTVTHVRDGDTIEVIGMPIRLNGLAAPEGDEPGGAAATRAMVELVDGRELRCDLNGERTHDRCVGICYLDGADIAARMVEMGVARDCPRFSGGRYRAAERRAADAGGPIRSTYPLPDYCRAR